MAAIATRSGAASFIVVALAVFLFRGLCRQRALADEAVRRRGSERRKKKENDARSCSFSRWEELCEDEEGKKKTKSERERDETKFFFSRASASLSLFLQSILSFSLSSQRRDPKLPAISSALLAALH